MYYFLEDKVQVFLPGRPNPDVRLFSYIPLMDNLQAGNLASLSWIPI